MKIELKSGDQNSDYSLGCIDLVPESQAESFKLGRMSQIMEHNNLDFRHNVINNDVMIRLPLIEMKESENA